MLDPLDQAFVAAVRQTPILGALIITMVWLGRKVMSLEKRLTQIQTRLEDLPCARGKCKLNHETPS